MTAADLKQLVSHLAASRPEGPFSTLPHLWSHFWQLPDPQRPMIRADVFTTAGAAFKDGVLCASGPTGACYVMPDGSSSGRPMAKLVFLAPEAIASIELSMELRDTHDRARLVLAVS